MNDRQRNIVVGITTLAGLVGLLVLIVLFGYLPEFMKTGYRVSITLPQTAGLHENSRVRYAGMDVGEVESVQLRKPPHTGIRITTLIRPDIRIPTQTQAVVSSRLLGGGASLNFYVEEPLGQNPTFLPTDGSAIVHGETSNMLVQAIQDTMKKPMADLDHLTDQFEHLSDAWSKVGANINKLIEVRSPEAVDAGEVTGNLSTVLERTDRRLSQLKTTLDGINQYVNDAQLHQDVSQTAANVRQISDTMAKSVKSLRDRYLMLADQLSKTANAVTSVAEEAKNGKGSVGKLLNDPALYNNLNDAVERLQKTIDDMRLLVQKWKAEGVPIQF